MNRIINSVLFVTFALIALVLQFACSGNNSPSTTSAPTPTPVPTISANFSASLMDFESGTSGDTWESEHLFQFFTTCFCIPSTMVAPITFGLNGYLGNFSPSNFPIITSVVNLGSGLNIILGPMPATLGQSLTWVTSVTVPSADQAEAAANSLPSNLYSNTGIWPVSMFWRLDVSAYYSFAGSSTAYTFFTNRASSNPVSNLNDLQVPQTVVLNIPVTIP